jgi:hypothetical protein
MAWRSRGQRKGDAEWRAGLGGDALMLEKPLIDMVGDEVHVRAHEHISGNDVLSAFSGNRERDVRS